MRRRSATSTGRSTSRSAPTPRCSASAATSFTTSAPIALQDVNIPFNSASMMSGPYIVPSLHMDVVVAATNKTPVSSIRGAGYPQAAFSMERMMDRVARELKLDRAEVRRRNLIPAEKMPYTKPLKARSGAADAIRQRRLSGLAGDGAEGRRLGRFPEAPGRSARAGPLHRHRPRARHQGHRPRAVRVRHRARLEHRQGHGVHRRRQSRTGTAHRAGADRRQRARPALGGHHRGAGRHLGRRARARRLRQPPDGHRRQFGAAGVARRSPRRRRSSPAICSKPPSTISN